MTSRACPDIRDGYRQRAPAEVLSGEELLVEEVSIDGMCGVY
ncbi:MAG TPA: mycofactocin precursor MftA [Streptosporangiaceae bacterium]